MKKIIQYQCELCNTKYEDEKEALACEAQGRAMPSVRETHIMYQLGDFYHNITFCVDIWEAYNVHACQPYLWACRDNGCGDSLGDEHCGSPNDICWHNEEYMNEYKKVTDRTSPHFRRMVKYFVDKSIDVRYWDGKKVITMSEDEVKQILKGDLWPSRK